MRGDLRVNVRLLAVSDRALIRADTSGAGKGGTLEVNAERIVLSNKNDTGGFTSGLLADSFAAGDGGALRVSANTLEILDGAAIRALLFRSGDGADIDITAGNVIVSGKSSFGFGSHIQTQLIGPNATGHGGNITITSDHLQLSDTGFIHSGLFNGSRGTGGNVTVRAGLLEISNRAFIAANALFGSGPNGATVVVRTPGNAGNIDIRVNTLTISGVATSSSPLDTGEFTGLSTSAFDGSGGDIQIVAEDFLMTNQGAIAAVSVGAGRGGTITIAGNNVALTNRAAVTASGFGTGNAGNINMTARDQVVMTDSSVTTEADLADGGNISLRASDLIHLTNSTVSSSVGNPEISTTTGGNITIDPQFVILENSRILANAFAGTGGNISIVAGVLLVDPLSVIDASSTKGVSGTITIQSPLSSLSQTLAPLPQSFLRTGALLSSRCVARLGGPASSLVVAGRDAIPMEPGGLLPSPLYEPGHLSVPASSTAAAVLPPAALSAGLTTDLVQECGS